MKKLPIWKRAIIGIVAGAIMFGIAYLINWEVTGVSKQVQMLNKGMMWLSAIGIFCICLVGDEG